jgi:hypothetical protein
MTPLSYSIVVRAAVEPGVKRVRVPVWTSVRPTKDSAGAVISMMSVFSVVFKTIW